MSEAKGLCEPKILRSLRARADQQAVELAKADQTIRNLEVEIRRLKVQLAEARSGPANRVDGVKL